MSPKNPDSEIKLALSDINHEFLRLITHDATSGVKQVLGLDSGVINALRRLDDSQLDMIARSPLLLAEFSPFPGLAGIRDLPARTAAQEIIDPVWQQELQGFANRLLTCIWHTARQDNLMSALFVGMDRDRCRVISGMSFARISRCAADAISALQVRLASHPCFWPDLIRLVCHGNRSQQIFSRLSAIQLTVAEQWPGTGRPSEPRYL